MTGRLRKDGDPGEEVFCQAGWRCSRCTVKKEFSLPDERFGIFYAVAAADRTTDVRHDYWIFESLFITSSMPHFLISIRSAINASENIIAAVSKKVPIAASG